MRDYTGKAVYVGMDVHKKTYSVTCTCEGTVVKRATMEAAPDNLLRYLERHFPGAQLKTAYEAGFSGFGLHRSLLNKGIESIVVHAASIEVSARDRVKTDKRDSLKIATQLEAGRLSGIDVPTVEREAWRELSRLRATLSVDKRRVGNRFKSLLYRHGLLGAEDVPVAKKSWIEKVVKEYNGDASIKLTMENFRDQWLYLNEQIKKLDKQLEFQAQADGVIDVIYQSAPGIGLHHARVLANELGDMKQFNNEKKLFSFTGLTPSEFSSGEHKKQGRITRQGRSILRKVLLQAAWVAIREDAALLKVFKRIEKNAGKKRAIVAVARRLIGRIRSCFVQGTLYEYDRENANVNVNKIV